MKKSFLQFQTRDRPANYHARPHQLHIRNGSEIVTRAHASCKSYGLNFWHSPVGAATLNQMDKM